MAFNFGGGATNGFGGFGAQPQQQPQNTGFGGFGAAAQPQAAAAPAFGGGFGTTNPFGGFGSQQPQQQQQQQQQPTAFGQQQQQQPSLFGSTTFGQTQPATTTGFGNFGSFGQQHPQQQQQQLGFGGVANAGLLAFGGQPTPQQVVVTEETLVKSVGDAFFARAVEVNALMDRLKGERVSLERAIKLPPPPPPSASNPAPAPPTSEYDTLLVNTRVVLLDQRKALQRTRKRMGVLRGEVDSLSGGLESTRAQGLGVLSRAPASDAMGGGYGGYSATEGPPFPSPLLHSFYDTSAARANELLFRLDELRQRLQVSVGEGGGRGEEGMQALLTDVKTTVAKVEGEHLAPLRERVEDMKHRVRLACAEVANNASRSPLWQQQQLLLQQQQQQQQQQSRGGGGAGGGNVGRPPEGIHLDPFAAHAKRVERAEQIRLEANRGRLKAAMSPTPPAAAPSTDAPAAAPAAGAGGAGAPAATAAAPAAGAAAPGAPAAPAPSFNLFGANPATAPATNPAFGFPAAPAATTAPAAAAPFGGFGFGGAAATTGTSAATTGAFGATAGGFGAPANTAANPFGFGGGAAPFGGAAAATTTNPFGGFSAATNFTSQQPGPSLKSKKK